jgi:spore germination protein KA
MISLKRLLARGKRKKERGGLPAGEGGNGLPSFSGSDPLDAGLEANLRRLKEIFSACSDVVFREFVFAQNEKVRLALVYLDGLVNTEQIGSQIMKALLLEAPLSVPPGEVSRKDALEVIRQRCLCVTQIREADLVGDVVHAVLSGDVALLADGHPRAIIGASRGWERRAIDEPEAEMSVRGPREGFVETLRVNTALLRRRIKSPRLKIETIRLGEVTATDVAIAYIRGIASEGVVEEVKKRLARIKLDGILESGYIEELIEDNPYSPFPTVNHTERPDRVAAYLLEGRVAILVDGTPVVLTVPNLFVEYLQAGEDYYERHLIASALRFLRTASAVASLVLPSFYVAVLSYHNELIPTSLMISLAAQREAVPYPVFVEILLMELVFEVLREAGLRLPRVVGQAVSIIGALVMGEAAVRAGLVAAATVITVAVTGIASFVVAYSASIAFRLLRFFLLALSAALGLFGLVSGVALIGVHLCALRSFGVPYLSPVVPTSPADLKDTAFRAPWWALVTRPAQLARRRQRVRGLLEKPSPPAGE